MKKRRILAAFFGILAAAGAAVTLMLALTARGRQTMMLKEDPRIMTCAQNFLDKLCGMDLEGASAELLGAPELNMVSDQDGVKKILWDRYWGGLEATLEGKPYAQGSFLTVNARITYPDMDAVIRQMGELTQTRLRQRVDEAENVSEVYNSLEEIADSTSDKEDESNKGGEE